MPLKKTLRELLLQGQLEEIAEMAVRKRRVLGVLVSLTYDSDPLIGWRAVEAMGLAADRLAGVDPQAVLNHLRRLYWLISEESGGQCWRAPEALAEVILRAPELSADYIPIVVGLIESMAEEDLEHFRARILWAIGRLSRLVGDRAQAVLPVITSALNNADPQVRGMAVWCLAELGQSSILANRPELLSDHGPVDLYQERLLESTTVASLVQRVLARTAHHQLQPEA